MSSLKQPAWTVSARHLVALATLAFALLVPSAAWAHRSSDGYLSLGVTNGVLSGRWDLPVRDLDLALGLDVNSDGVVTWGELRRQQRLVEDYLAEKIRLQADDEIRTLQVRDHLIDARPDGTYLVLLFEVEDGAAAGSISVEYHALFDLDAQHRGMVRLETANGPQTAILSPSDRHVRFDIARPDRVREFFSFVWEGVWHIWIGYDHVLFLLALLLPAIAVRGRNGWAVAGTPRSVMVRIFQVVTAFTLAHSLTLALSTLGILRFPGRVIESLIAASVILAAVLNLSSRGRMDGWKLAFGFGLVHGFGFAEVLRDLGLQGGSLMAGLAAFNLGVELGQLAIVLAVTPAILCLRRSPWLSKVSVTIASILIAIAATIWMVERLLGIQLVRI